MSTPSARRRRCGRPIAAADPAETALLEIEIEGGDEPVFRRAAESALAAAGVSDGHVAISFVSEAEIRELNERHRGRDTPTDVLSFPVDGPGDVPGPRELGDIVICPERTEDMIEAVVHGVLHLCGYDHEIDRGEMLDLQRRIMREL